MPERTYTQEEVALLFERAAELQARSARHQQGEGLTLAELERIAAEAGLDPAAVRAAAAELDAPGRPLTGRRSGATATHVYTERWVPGPLREEAWEETVAELRHRFDSDLGDLVGMHGYGTSTTEQIGRAVEWRHTSLSGVETRVLVQPRGEHLCVRGSRRVGLGSPPGEAAVLGLLSAAAVALFALPVAARLDAFWVGMAVTLLTLLAAVPLIHRLTVRWRRKKHAELESLLDDVATLLAGPAPVERAAGVVGERIVEGAGETVPARPRTPDDPEDEPPKASATRTAGRARA